MLTILPEPIYYIYNCILSRFVSMSILAKAVDLNSRFNEMGQLLSATDADLKEFAEVMASMASQSLDRTTQQLSLIHI